MSLDSVRIELRLDILPDGRIPVPGCEPLSDATSGTLLQRYKCRHTLVSLRKVLELIPGARVEYGLNGGLQGARRRWLVLPPRSQACCQPVVDWYALLRGIEEEPEPVVERYGACEVLPRGFCPEPGPGRRQPQDPYLPEGGTPEGAYVNLGSWVPPWQAGDKRTPDPAPYDTEPPNPRARYGPQPELSDPEWP